MNKYAQKLWRLACCCPIQAALALLFPLMLVAPAAHAQSGHRLVLTTYYDPAHTQRRTVYHARLVGPTPDTVVHGPFRRYWPGGSLQELGRFTEGQADSIWTRYYPTKAGQKPVLARRLSMQDGKPEGAFTVWHPDGRVGQRGTFRGGQLVDSLVTYKADGQRRLLAQFTESPDGRLQGSFWQREGRYTALPLSKDLWLDADGGYSNPYPAYDPRRYWTGQLAAGRLTGLLTERDADGQPTIRLSYTAQGRLRLVTRYYPAEWRRHALLQDFDEATRLDSVILGHVFWQWEPVSRQPLFILRRWGVESETPTVTLLRVAAAARHPEVFHGDIVGARDQAMRLASFPPELTTQLEHLTAPNQASDCQPSQAAYRAHLQPSTVLLVSRPGRWLLGEADTTGATHRPRQRQETGLADGRRQVETARSTRTYYPDGRLESVEYRRHLGRQLLRSYFPGGRQQLVDRQGLLATYSRSWSQEGHKSGTELERVVGVRMVRKRVVQTRKGQRVSVTKTRPRLWESKKSRRRRYHPH